MDIISRVCVEWKDRMTEDNVSVCWKVTELVYVIDGMDEWLLEKGKSMIVLIIFVLINVYV